MKNYKGLLLNFLVRFLFKKRPYKKRKHQCRFMRDVKGVENEKKIFLFFS